MEFVHSIFLLQQSTSESELLKLLHALTVTKLKLLCKENAMKTLGSKANIIGQLVTTWKAACNVSPETCGTIATATIDMPAFNEICSWTKDLMLLTHFTFMYHCTAIWSTARRKHLINQWRPSNCSRRTNAYFADGLVMNVWTHYLQREDSRLVVCTSLLMATKD